MNTLIASISWFMAGWFIYSFAAFFMGMPRQVTPLVALGIAVTVGLALRGSRMDRTCVATRSVAQSNLRNIA